MGSVCGGVETDAFTFGRAGIVVRASSLVAFASAPVIQRSSLLTIRWTVSQLRVVMPVP